MDDSQPHLLRAVLDAAPMAAAIIGADGTVRLWNDAAERLSGWAAADVMGRQDPTVPDEARETHAEELRQWARRPEHARRRRLRRQRPDGTTVFITLDELASVELEDGPALVVWWSEATDVDALLIRRNRLARRLVGANRIEDVLPVVTTAVRGLLGGSAALVLRPCPPAEHLHGLRAFGLETEVAEQLVLRLGEEASWDRAVAGRLAGGTVEVGGDTTTVTFVPMGPDDDGWVMAVLGVDAEHATAHVRDLFHAVADETFDALQRVALITDLDGKIEILEATNHIASSVGLDLDDALAEVTRHAAEALSCERAATYLRDAETGELRLAQVHASDAAPEQLLADDDGQALAAEVVRTGREVLFQDVSACEIADGPWHADAGSVAVMGLPLRVGTRTTGALVVAHTVAHPRGFTSLCQQVGGAVAQQAALAFEHSRLYDNQRRSVEDLRELERVKADWVTGLTHDLRGPLTALVGFIETLRNSSDKVTPDQQREFLGVMSAKARQLVDLVEDLLLSARVDADAVARRRQLLRVDELLDTVLAQLGPDQRSAVSIADAAVDATIVGDSSHLQRVLLNLLGNARQHGGDEVVVTIDNDGGDVVVGVEDDGPGVPEDDRELVFERFQHGGHEASSGLGLYVARGIVEAHDGTLVATDRGAGRSGVRFEVRLPHGRRHRAQDVDDVDVLDRRVADSLIV